MEAIYDAHMRELGAQDQTVVRGALGARRINSGDEDLDGYTREAFNELDVTFPRLPNPSLVMYVFPHLAGAERTPVPGYTTTFPLYERVEYALPGEVATPRWAHEQAKGGERVSAQTHADPRRWMNWRGLVLLARM
jgi:conjugative transfer region lipoprotein (TIGR03751 family)